MLNSKQQKALLDGPLQVPHDLLGLHTGKSGDLEFRAFLPGARVVELVDLSADPPIVHGVPNLGDDGFFGVVIPGHDSPFPYRLRLDWGDGSSAESHDPYAFGATLTEPDLESFNQGDDALAHHKLGAHSKTIGEVSGYAFSVWAPRADAVSLVGELNAWDDRRHRMRRLGDTGVWELFVPGVEERTQYKFRIFSRGGFTDKADPFATFSEGPPGNAALTCDLGGHVWSDTEWMERRPTLDPRTLPMSVYEVHLGSWRRKSDGSSLSYLELADELPPYLKEHGFTHLEFLPLAEHPLGASWGYQVTGYFAPTSRFGPPGDFKRLVDALHTAGIGVIMDWVPAHFPRDEFALANFDGWPTYEYADPRMGEHQDWGTLVFDYARPEVRSFLMSSAVSWLDRYHVDGLRVDAVASMLYLDYSRKEGEWLPNRRGGRENLEAITLLKQTNEEVHRLHPGTVMIAEESTAFPKVTGKVSDGGLGFDFKWNMGWMHDVLEYFNASPTDRLALSSKLTFGCTYQFSENYVHVFSHDEVVHGKSPMIFKMSAGEEGVSGHAAQLRSFYAYTWAWPGKKTLFMGSEFGQTTEWNCDSSLDWDLLQHTDHAGLARLIRDLNNLYRSHAFLGAGDHLSDKFRWIECGEGAPAIFSFFRFGDSPEDTLLVACNFSDEPAQGHRVGVPVEGCWRMILHSRDELYGGSLKDFDREIFSENVSADEWENSLMMDLQAHATIFFMPASE